MLTPTLESDLGAGPYSGKNEVFLRQLWLTAINPLVLDFGVCSHYVLIP